MTWEATPAIAAVSGSLIWIALDYFGFSKETMTIMTVLLVLDFIAGVAEVWIKRKDELTSNKAIQWLFRKISRWLLPFIVVLVMKGAGLEDINYLSMAVCWIIIVSEGYSILWHIYAINSEWSETLPEIDALSALITFVWKIFKTAIENKGPREIGKESSLDNKEGNE